MATVTNVAKGRRVSFHTVCTNVNCRALIECTGYAIPGHPLHALEFDIEDVPDECHRCRKSLDWDTVVRDFVAHIDEYFKVYGGKNG